MYKLTKHFYLTGIPKPADEPRPFPARKPSTMHEMFTWACTNRANFSESVSVFGATRTPECKASANRGSRVTIDD